jgi:hypothetical protein
MNAFLDETEQEAGLGCVAGCVIPLEDWKKFEKAWQSVLDGYGVWTTLFSATLVPSFRVKLIGR